MYEYVVNKHACPTDVTLQSVAVWHPKSDLFTITIPRTSAITPINSVSLTAERCYWAFAHMCILHLF